MSQEEVLEMGVPVRLPRSVVLVVAGRGEAVGPSLDVVDKAGFIIVHINGRGDMHRRDEGNPFVDLARSDDASDPLRDVDEFMPMTRLEPEVLGDALHDGAARSFGSFKFRRPN